MNNSSRKRMGLQTVLVSVLATAWISIASALSDGASLLAIRQAWNLNESSWQGDDPCNAWDRVSCDADNRVSYLNLSNMGVMGPIPAELSNLDHLTNLDLSNARRSAPPYNLIRGDLSPLGPLTRLLYLYEECLMFLKNFSQVAAIRKMIIIMCKAMPVFETSELITLSFVCRNISFNEIQLDTFPVVIYNLTNLLSLRVDNNNISGPVLKKVAQLTKLQFLYIGNNSLTGPIPPELGSMASLREISMWNNNLESTIPPEFGNLRNLTYLNLHDCGLYGGLPKEMGNLKNIVNITLYSNQLTGAIPDSWSNMTSLRNLLLHLNFLTKTIPSGIIDLPSLYNLSIGYNLFYGGLNLDKSNLSIMSVTCNFLSGPAPTTPPKLLLDSTGNCFDMSDLSQKIKCSQSYYNCEAFLEAVPNGGCPNCPGQQFLDDPVTCVCTLNPTGGSASKKKLIGFLVGMGLFIGLVLAILGIWFRQRRKSTSDLWEGPDGVQRYLYRDLARATYGFNGTHEIGMGGFGKVFLGVVDGKKVAIKRAHASSIQSSSGFRNEVVLLSRLHHRNLVRLLGFCEEDGIQILVYEYMTNGNLHTFLFKNESGIKLDWLKRLDIALGVAQGLEYLHSFADPPVIHRDVKPSNVLLDENMVAKLSDFGISRVAPEEQTEFSTRPAGTVGYIDPQYILREHLTTASDVYSFGVVLLELASGRKAIDNTRPDEHNLIEWAKLKLRTEGLKGIIDPELGNNYPEKVYFDIVRLAIDCASFASEIRPSMKVVVSILDACRWSVAPHVHEEMDYTLESFGEDEDEGFLTRSNDQTTGLAKDIYNSSADGTKGTFSVSVLMPR